MERLTKRVDGIAVLESWGIDKDPVSIIQKMCNRLAAYEDTSLEPEQVMELKSFTQGGIHKVDDGWKHVQDLLQAEQDGRLVVLPPCMVVCGTTIWWADSNFHTDPIKCEVSSFGIYTGPDGDLQAWMNCYVYGSTPMSQSFRMSSIGKTVFLTRDEAEAAIKEANHA